MSAYETNTSVSMCVCVCNVYTGACSCASLWEVHVQCTMHIVRCTFWSRTSHHALPNSIYDMVKHDDKRYVSIKLRWKWQTNGMKHLVWLFGYRSRCYAIEAILRHSRLSDSKECDGGGKPNIEVICIFNALQIVLLCCIRANGIRQINENGGDVGDRKTGNVHSIHGFSGDIRTCPSFRSISRNHLFGCTDVALHSLILMWHIQVGTVSLWLRSNWIQCNHSTAANASVLTWVLRVYNCVHMRRITANMHPSRIGFITIYYWQHIRTSYSDQVFFMDFRVRVDSYFFFVFCTLPVSLS